MFFVLVVVYDMNLYLELGRLKVHKQWGNKVILYRIMINQVQSGVYKWVYKQISVSPYLNVCVPQDEGWESGSTVRVKVLREGQCWCMWGSELNAWPGVWPELPAAGSPVDPLQLVLQVLWRHTGGIALSYTEPTMWKHIQTELEYTTSTSNDNAS